LKQLLFLFLTQIVVYAAYVGDQSCKGCHQQEHKQWQGSHHDLAMQEAMPKTVLGNFDNASIDYNGIVTTFYKKDNAFMVRTDGPDGRLHDYEISYAFGVYPLQQYMVKFPKGHVQVLDIAWDARSRKEGGQRWFHIHQDQNVTHDDVLHWSGPNFNWNYMCADCHSTNLKKNYDPQTKSYDTRYSQINVSCEACHSEGSEHLEWARSPKSYKGPFKRGLRIDLSAFAKERWRMDAKTHKPKLLTAIDRGEVQLCAKCHSRRSQLDDDFAPGDSSADLDEPLYFSDGKIKDEVYVYNSFKQSRMYEAGVTCSDCHDAHTLKRNGAGDQVCNQCHFRPDYAAESHSFHKPGSASCIDCHMPSRIYMGVDERNDHSFRIPRPDLSVGSDIPNACNACHSTKDAAWAADSMKKWYGKVPVGKQDFAHSLQSLRRNSEDAQASLYEILTGDAPDIAKATAVGYLGNYPSQQTYMTVMQMLRSESAMKRLNALRSLHAFAPRLRVRKTFDMLNDPEKIVRIEAARQLSSLEAGEMDTQARAQLERGIAEYEATLLFNADRAESQTALAGLYMHRQRYDKVEPAYREALRIQPKFVPAYVNYADYLSKKGEEERALAVLQRGLEEVSDSGALYLAAGLWHVRHQNREKALQLLGHAAELGTDDAYTQYVYAVALAESDTAGAIKVLEASLKRHTGDMATLQALSYYYTQTGDTERAEHYRSKIESLTRFRPLAAQR